MRGSISFNQSHKSSISHNNRLHLSGNPDIDRNRIYENTYYISKPIQEVYAEVFDKAVGEYNAKQKRNDRKIENYYEKVRKDEKTHEQRELVIAVGKKDDEIPWDKKKGVLDQYAKEFQERNPNLAVYNMVLHLDEANPHLHINYVPHFESTRGLAKRVGMDKALQQQGIEGTGRGLIAIWREKETSRIEELCKQIIPEFERENVGSHKYMKVPQYKEYAENLSRLKVEKEKLVLESEKIGLEASEKEMSIKTLEEKLDVVLGTYNSFQSDVEKLKSEKKKLIKEITASTPVDEIPFETLEQKVGGKFGIGRQTQTKIVMDPSNFEALKMKAKHFETYKRDHDSLRVDLMAEKSRSRDLKQSLGQTIDLLKNENDSLKKENQSLKMEVKTLKQVIEKTRSRMQQLFKTGQEVFDKCFGYAYASVTRITQIRPSFSSDIAGSEQTKEGLDGFNKEVKVKSHNKDKGPELGM